MNDLSRRLRALGDALDRAARGEAEATNLLDRERARLATTEEIVEALVATLSTMNHELRPALSIAKSWAELTRVEPMSVRTRADALSIVERNIEASLDVLDDVIPLWQSGPVEPRWTELEPAVRRALAGQTLRLPVDVSHLAGRALVDATQLERVVGRALSIAEQLAANGSRLEASTKTEPLELAISFEAGADMPSSITENWSDLREVDPSSIRHRLFVAKKVAKMIGGDLELECGTPSVLRLRLPEGSAKRREHLSVESLAGVRVSVVDADEDWRELVAHLLERRGATLTSDDPHVLIRAFDASDDVDPRATFSIALLPSTASGSTFAAALERGYRRCLKKPFSPAQLARLLDEGVRARRSIAPAEPIRNALASLVPLAADGCALDQVLEGGERRRLAVCHVDGTTQRAMERGIDEQVAPCRARVRVHALDGFRGELVVFRSEPLWALEEALVCTTAERIGDLLDKRALLQQQDVALAEQAARQPLQALLVGFELVITRIRDSADEVPRAWLLERMESLFETVKRLTALVSTRPVESSVEASPESLSAS